MLDRLDGAVIVDQALERDVPVVVRDRGDVAAAEKVEQHLLHEAQHAAHAADDELLDAAAAVAPAATTFS